MGNSYVYGYPEESGPLHADDLGETLSEIVEEDIVECATPMAANGTVYPSLSGYHYRIRFVLRGFQSATPGTSGNSVERALQAVKNHVNRGGLIGVSLDHAKTFAALCTNTPAQAATSLVTTGNAFNGWSSSGVVAAEDEVVVETPGPFWKRDTVQVSAYSSGTITVGALRYAHVGYPMVRYRYFWPVLFRYEDDGDAATNIVRTDRAIHYELDMTLRYSPDVACAIVGAGGSDGIATNIGASPATALRGTSAGVGGSVGVTLQGLVREHAGALTPGSWGAGFPRWSS